MSKAAKSQSARWIDPGELASPDLASAFDDLCLWSAPFGLALLDTIRMRGVSAFLDVGCGPGFPLLEIASRFGPRTRAVGLDPWESGLDRAREKARTRGLTHVELTLGTAEDMPFATGAFDLLVSNNGLNNVADLSRSLAECARVAKPGAQLVITANLPDSMRELYEVYEAVLHDLGRADLIPRVAAHIDHKRKPIDVQVALLEAAGFRHVRTKERSFRLRFASGAALFQAWFMRLGFVEAWASVLPPELVPQVFDEIASRLDARAAELDEVTLTVPFACIEAIRG